MNESQISTLTTIENGNSFDYLYKNTYQVNDDSISKFYKVLHNYLEHEHQIDKLNQLFSIILSFFTVNINHALPFLDDLLKNYKLNSNYVIITATILSKITYSNPKPTIPEYTFLRMQHYQKYYHKFEKKVKLRYLNMKSLHSFKMI